MIPKVGLRVAELVAKAIDADSGPKVARRGGLATQSIYHYRDGRLPSRLAIALLAKCLRVSRGSLEGAVAADEADRRGARGSKAGVA